MFPVLIDLNIKLDLLHLVEPSQLFLTVENNREYLRRWLPWADATKTLTDCINFLQTCQTEYQKHESITLGVWQKEELIGALSLREYDRKTQTANMGYWVSETWQGKGIVTKACQALLKYAFNELQFQNITITCAVHNHKSQAIPKRLGFYLDKLLPNEIWLYDHHVDAVLYKISYDMWQETT